ncbi:MAG TPA: M56 family metallopeptidase [Thermoanaerobaculia bacterium]|nr:M56 family metallopeptidase [Thermoanaerobaculia bacterium]
MNAPTIFSGPSFSILGWALFHFLWQGALVALVVAALAWLLRKRSPSLRYALACAALATMVALPVATAWSLAARASRSDDSGIPVTARLFGPVRISPAASSGGIASAESFLPAGVRDRLEELLPWALSVWFAGVLFLSIRFLGGLAAARRLTCRATRPAPPVWQETLARIAGRLSITRPVQLLESGIVKVPTAIGAFRPVILFPATVFLGLPTRGLEALIAHELAHVRRHDYLVNLLQTVAETLLFYHPAVWWVSARVRSEREQGCDDLAIAATGDPRTYARALMRLEEMRASAPALAVAAGGGNLWKRIVRLLTQRPAEADRPAGWLAAVLALATMVVLGAAVRLGPASARAEDPVATLEPDTVVHAFAAPSDRVEPAAPAEAVAEPDETPVPEVPESAMEPDEPVIAETVEEAEAPEAPVPPEPRALTDDDLLAFRNHGVTPEFVRSLAALGYEKADPDDILSLAIHGVTVQDIGEMNRIFGKRPLDEHVSFKIHGVTPQEVLRLSALGLGNLSPDDVVAMKIHGVDAAYVEKLRSAGYRQVSAEDVISARIHGVQPADAQEWGRLGYASASLEDLVSARIHGVSPEFAAQVRSVGFSNLPLEDLAAFRIHGVTDDYLREMKSLGFAPPAFTADDAVAFRIHGVTPEFVREIRSLGYPNATAEDLTALRIHGISAEQIRKENSRGSRRVPLEDIVEQHSCGKESDDEN